MKKQFLIVLVSLSPLFVFSQNVEVVGGIIADSINVSSGLIKNVANPVDAQDAVTKSYIEKILLDFALATMVDTSKTVQGLLNAGVAPREIITSGIDTTHFIGLNHEGGIIFYMESNGAGLVAAPTDAPTSLAWGNSGGSNVGCNGEATGATLTGIGDGVTNTMTVLDALCDSNGSAFNYVDTLSLGNYEDWFLPSKDELYEMYKNLHRYGCSAAPPGGADNSTCTTSLGNFAASLYWSSSDFSAAFAWGQYFDDGIQGSDFKDYIDGVRAIRAFGVSTDPAGIQGLLNVGVSPSTIINNGASLSDFIGLNHEGGVIFYMNPNGDGTGLVAAPEDQSTGAGWGCEGTITGADGITMGTGNQNTIAIDAGCTTSGIAADLCANLSLNGSDDWFLPSQDELNLMWKNLHRFGCSNEAPVSSTCPTELGGFDDSNFYWSSSEFDANNAWGQSFLDGGQFSAPKGLFPLSVRAIRAF